jgi:hypothetical protein
MNVTESTRKAQSQFRQIIFETSIRITLADVTESVTKLGAEQISGALVIVHFTTSVSV